MWDEKNMIVQHLLCAFQDLTYSQTRHLNALWQILRGSKSESAGISSLTDL